jgi:hypothetical protein
MNRIPNAWMLFLVTLSWIASSASVWSQSPLPQVLEHRYEEIQQAFDQWQVPEGDHPEEVLLEEMRLRYDERGAMTRTTRRIWRLKSKQVSEFGILTREYAPWYENPPTVRARVFDTQGREFQLSKDDITYSPAGSRDQGVLSDRMVMQAALPGLRVGGIVEEVIEVAEREPFFEPGTYERIVFDTMVPGLYQQIEIDAPEALPIRWAYRTQSADNQQPPENVHESQQVAEGRRTVRIRLQPRRLVPMESLESDVPRELNQLNSLAVFTGVDWQSIARRYSELIENRLRDEPLRELADEILAERPDEVLGTIEAKLHHCAAWIRQNIRYTGVELGNAAIVPARPTTVVARRFGDCKDQATLLVGVLREMGVSADVALVNATIARLPTPDVPCLNAFDHAIVVVRHPMGDLWIDPTYPGSTPRCIPDYLQGRWALIANPTETGLTRIPSLGMEGNQDQETRVITVTALGNATVQSEGMQSGYFAADARSEASMQTQGEEAKSLVEHYAQSGISAKFELQYRSDPSLDEPTFVRKTELRDFPLEALAADRYRIDLTFRGAVSNCRYFHLIEKTEKGTDKPRQYGAECIVPYRWSRRCHMIPPAGFRVQTRVQNHALQVGIVGLSLTHQHHEDGSLTVEQSLSVDAGILSPGELQQLSALAMQFEANDHPLHFTGVMESKSDRVEGGRSHLISQLNEAREVWGAEPSGDAGYRYIVALVAVGQVDEARAFAQQFIEQLPEEGMAHCGLAYTLLHDEAGRELGFGCDVRGSEQACRRAIELSPHRWQPYYLLSILIDVDDHGVYQNDSTKLGEMLSILEPAEARGVSEESLMERKVVILIRMQRMEEAIAPATLHGLEQLQNVAKVVKAARESRWSEIAAMRERIPSATEREIIAGQAEQFLLTERDYQKPARVVLTLRGMSERDIEARQKTFAKIVPVDRPKDPTQSAETVVREFLTRVVAQGNHPEAWADIVSNAQSECIQTGRLSALTDDLRVKFTKVRACVDRIYDTCCHFPMRLEGNDELGYIAKFKLQLESDIAVVHRDGKYQVLLSGPGFRDYALRAQQFLDAGQPELANRWIDWALRGQSDGVMLNAETGHPIKRYWTTSRKKTPETMRIVIEMMLSASDLSDERVRFLFDAIAAEKSANKRQWLYLSMQMNPNTNSQLGEVLQAYVEEFPNSVSGKTRLAMWQARQGDSTAAESYLSENPSPNDPIRQQFEDMLRFYRGEFATMVAERSQTAIRTNLLDDWNRCLWAGLFADQIEETWLEDARELMTQTKDMKALHTLACAEAHVGDIDRAMVHLVQLVDSQASRLENVDYWILGRIAEHCQLPERARAYYGRVKPGLGVASTFELAKKRLEWLNSQTPSAESELGGDPP